VLELVLEISTNSLSIYSVNRVYQLLVSKRHIMTKLYFGVLVT